MKEPGGGEKSAETRLNIKSWPEDERPREKMMARGAADLTDSELLAVLIRTGEGRGRTALDLGRSLWLAFGGNWDALLAASPSELTGQKGMGPAKAASVAAALEIARRANANPITRKTRITEAKHVYDHFKGRIKGMTREKFFALLLDASGKLIKEEEISVGTLTECLVHPREAYRPAVRESAASVIFVHNHPGGDPRPSAGDVELTRSLMAASKVLDIPMLDHVIISGCGYYSFVESRPGGRQ